MSQFELSNHGHSTSCCGHSVDVRLSYCEREGVYRIVSHCAYPWAVEADDQEPGMISVSLDAIDVPAAVTLHLLCLAQQHQHGMIREVEVRSRHS